MIKTIRNRLNFKKEFNTLAINSIALFGIGIYFLSQNTFAFWPSKLACFLFLLVPLFLNYRYLKNLYSKEKERNYFLDKIFLASPSIVFLYDYHCQMASVINGNIDYLGYSPDELKKFKYNIFELLIPQDKLDSVNSSILKVIQLNSNDKSYKCEWQIKNAKNEIRILSVCLTQFSIDDKEQQILGFAEDVTHMKEIENQIESDKRRMQEMEKYSAIKDLGAGVAHEINNPLAIILGRAQSLKLKVERGTATPSVISESLEKIETNVKRISKIVTALRLMTKDGSSDAFELVEINTLLEDIETLWSQRLKNHEIDLIIDKPNENHLLYIRRAQIVSAFFNLLSNSFEAVQKSDQKWIKISTKVYNDVAEFYVIDSGPGISSDLKSKIFDPFFTTQAAKNSGLGLSVAKGILVNHDGNLKLDSNAVNTTFILSIPLKQSSKSNAA